MSKLKLSFPYFRLAARCEAQMGEHEGGRLPRPNRSNSKTRTRAIELRKELTPAESKLWSQLRNDQLGVSFRRQHAIGNYIADFCAVKDKLIIELDGSQHLEQTEYDAERTVFLESKGYRVLRFWNNDVMNDIDTVLKVIWGAVNEKSSL